MTVAEKDSSLSYLRLLQSSRSCLASLVEDLKTVQYKGIQGAEQIGSVSAALDQNLDDLFVPYLENGRYIEKEVKSLQELYSSFLYKYNGFHVNFIPKPNPLTRGTKESHQKQDVGPICQSDSI